MKEKNIYQFKVKDIRGKDFDFSQLKGKKIMIVNTASQCGFTSQYEGLEALYEEYKDHHFVIVGFPSDDFGHQEPGSNQEIAEFCLSNYGVSFPMMSKINVIGTQEHPLYTFLTEKSENGVMDSEIKWNFQKYLINEKGQLEKVFYSRVPPESEEIISWIES